MTDKKCSSTEGDLSRIKLEFKQAMIDSYMKVLIEGYRSSPTSIKAKKIWLMLIADCKPIPRDILTEIFNDIKKQVDDYEINKQSSEAQKRKELETELFKLLYVVKTDINLFWKILHQPESLFMPPLYSETILEKLRKWLPEERKFRRGEIYAIFNEIYKKSNHPPMGPPFVYEDSFAQKYRRRPKNFLK